MKNKAEKIYFHNSHMRPKNEEIAHKKLLDLEKGDSTDWDTNAVVDFAIMVYR